MLRDIYSELNDSHSLSDMPRRAIPAALATLKERLPEAKWCAPQLSGPAAQIRTQFQKSLQPALGEQGAGSLVRDSRPGLPGD